MITFWTTAVIAVISAIFLVVNRNPVLSALCLIVTFFMQAVLYLTLSAQFIAAVQVIVYAGAIMVLFLFVIMLLNLGAPEALRESGTLQTPVAILLALVFMVLLLGAGAIGIESTIPPASHAFLMSSGTVESIGKTLFDPNLPWLFPFEVTSILLLVGVIGAVVLAKRRL